MSEINTSKRTNDQSFSDEQENDNNNDNDDVIDVDSDDGDNKDEIVVDGENEDDDGEDDDDDDDDDDEDDDEDDDDLPVQPSRGNQYYDHLNHIDKHPLRRAIVNNESPNIIIPLIEKAYKLQQRRQKVVNKHEEYLLHLACWRSQYDIVIMKIIELFPNSVQYKANDGNYPLHLACEHHKNDDVLMKLMQAFPKPVKRKNNILQYPLHLACSGGQSDHVVLKLLDIFPKAAKYHSYNNDAFIRDCNDGYALHVACRNQQSVVVIKQLIDIYRKALQVKHYHDGKYPIHCAIDNYGNNESSIDVIKLLIHEDPLALQRLNKRGESPFHMAYRLDDVLCLEEMAKHPTALVNMKDHNNGATLLHRAAMSSYGDDETDRVYEVILQHPDINVNVKDNDGNTPLHIATKSRRLSLVRFLLDHPLIMIDEKNNENKTPLNIMKEKTEHIKECLTHGIEHELDEYYNQVSLHDQLPIYLEIIKLFEDFSTKRRYNAYLYHLSIIVDL